MRDSPLVSVIIPCYNGEALITRALHSVLAQTYSNLEIIVVDDGSRDRSCEVVSALAEDRVRLIKHAENMGIPSARNTGIRCSRGDFVCLLDQDDWWLPDKVRRQLEVFDRHPQAGLVFSDLAVYKGNKEVRVIRNTRRWERYSNRVVATCLFLYGSFVPSVTAMFPRRVVHEIGYFNEELRGGADDYEFWLRLALRFQVVHLPEVLAVRQEHGENYTSIERMLPDLLRITKEFEHIPYLKSLAKRRNARTYYRLGKALYQKGDTASARTAFLQAARLWPLGSFRPLLLWTLCSFGFLGGRRP